MDYTIENRASKLSVVVGTDKNGNETIYDFLKMSHLLLAGSNDSEMRACLSSLIISLIDKAEPADVRMILIDPMDAGLSVYNGVPHLLLPVVQDSRKALEILRWVTQEMNRRYAKFKEMNVHGIRNYNAAVAEARGTEKTIPMIVVVINELSELLKEASEETQDLICQIAQMAYASGIYLVVATRRPSTDVLTGLIRANIASRMAFSVSSKMDSRLILDQVGAEKLNGKGEVLFKPIGAMKAIPIQGVAVSMKEVCAAVEKVRSEKPDYNFELIRILQQEQDSETENYEHATDEYLKAAIEFVVKEQKAGISMLQRKFEIGYKRAERLMEIMHAKGIVDIQEGYGLHKVLIPKDGQA